MTNKKVTYYFKNLDGMRFIAAVFVIIGHCQAEYWKHFNKDPYFPYANKLAGFGVDFFFVLSGFLISFLLFQELESTGTINIKNFYIRRILRLWPLYLLIGLLGILTANYILPALDLMQQPQTGKDLVVNLLFLITFTINFQTLIGWMNYASSPTVGHFWSLSIEEQFYLIWAPLLRYFKKHIIPFISVMILIGFIFTEIPFNFYKTFFNTNAQHAPLMFTPTRFFHFGLGGLLAWLILHDYATPSVKLPKTSEKILQWAFLLPFFWYLCRELFFDKHERIINGIASMILVGIAISPQCVFNFEYKWMKYLGKISFGIYVFHMLGVHLAWTGLEALHISGVSFIILLPIVAAIIAIGLAVLSYEYFEKWFLKLKNKFK